MRSFGAVRCVGGLFLLLALAGLTGLRAEEGGKEEMVPNHIYKHWSAFQVGASVHRKETVKFAPDSEAGRQYPDATLVKETKYELTNLTKEKAVVEVYEIEHGHGYTKVSAPIKMIYHAMIPKGHGKGTPKESFTKHKQEEVSVEIKGKTYKATLIETSYKVGPETSTQKIWLSDEMPGGILKNTITRKNGDKLVTESTLEVVSFKIPK
jgi:hypothetical protein